MPTDLVRDLRLVSASSEELAVVETDASLATGRALAHVTPNSTEEVVEVLRVCREHGVGVTVRGGGTGLVGGAVPDATVVLSTRRLDRIGPVEHGAMVVGAGVTLAQVQQRARRHGWDYGVDLPTRDAATVGGTLATDASGVHLPAHGSTRDQVLGVEAVLADGSVVRQLGGTAPGPDLGQLLVASEGTLGVVTAVRLRLVPLPGPVETALVACASVAAAVELLDPVRLRVPGLRAAELVLADAAALVQRVTGTALPVAPAPAYVLLQALAVPGSPGAGLAAAVRPSRTVLDVLVAPEGPVADAMWDVREQLPACVASRAAELVVVPLALDVSVPPARLAGFLDALPREHETVVWGRLVDGALQVSVLGGDEAVRERVLRLAAEHGGQVAAQWGVGRAARRWLELSRTPAELAALRALKAALDPGGLLSPGVLLP